MFFFVDPVITSLTLKQKRLKSIGFLYFLDSIQDQPNPNLHDIKC